jgi:hypothetical protein
MKHSNYLPDELLLEILEYIEHWDTAQRQPSLARFCSVSRQWYDVGIRKLYEAVSLWPSVRVVCAHVLSVCAGAY